MDGEADEVPEDQVDDQVEETTTEEDAVDPLGESTEETAEVEAEEEEEAQPKEKPAPSSAPSVKLISRATRVGLSEEEIDDALQRGGSEALEYAIGVIERRMPREDSTRAQKASAKSEEPGLGDFPKFEDLDEGLRKYLESIHGHLSKSNDRLREAQQQFYDELNRQRFDTETRIFESTLKALPDAEKVFGKGNISRLPKDSKERESRIKLWQTTQMLRDNAAARGEYLDIEDAAEKAYRMEFGTKLEMKAKQEKAAERRAGQSLSKPSARKGTELSGKGDKVALAKMAEFWESRKG